MIAGQAEPGEVECADEAILGDLFFGQGLAGFAPDFANEGLHGLPVIEADGEDSGDGIAPVMKPFAVVGDMARDLVGKAEVSQKKAAWLQLLDGVKGSVPEFELNVRRGRSGKHERMALNADAGCIADKCDACGRVKVGDVMGSVTRSVEHLQLPRAKSKNFTAMQNVEISFGHREEFTKETLHVGAIQAFGARDEYRWIGHVTCAARMNINLQVRILQEKRAGSAGVVEVNVGKKNGLQLGYAEVVCRELFAELLQRNGRAGIDKSAEIWGE